MSSRHGRVPAFDWAGATVFVLALAIGMTVVIVSTLAMVRRDMLGNDVLSHAVSAILGAMIGAVSTYVGQRSAFAITVRAARERDMDDPGEPDAFG